MCMVARCIRPPNRFGGCGVPVAESALAPPGPIPNPVVTQRSAGEYCGGDPTGGEAAAGTPHPRAGGEEARSREGDVTTRIAETQDPTRGGAAAARWAHNPKVGGSNPPPATSFQKRPSMIARSLLFLLFLVLDCDPDGAGVLPKQPELLNGLLATRGAHVGADGDRREERLELRCALEEITEPLGDVAQPPQEVGRVLIVVPFVDQAELSVLALVELQPAPRPSQRRIREPGDQTLQLGELGQRLVVDHPPLRDLLRFDISPADPLGEHEIVFPHRVTLLLEEATSGVDEEPAQEWLHAATAQSAPLERHGSVI